MSNDLKKKWEELLQKEPKTRIRNAARKLGVSEMELLVLDTENIVRLRPEHWAILQEVKTLGRVMALTRNDDCVHERKGEYLNANMQGPVGLFVGKDIDLRLFLNGWGHAFAVKQQTQRDTRHSIQFFGKDGQAIHKIYMIEDSDMQAYDALIQKFKAVDQEAEIVVELTGSARPEPPDDKVDIAGFRQGWKELQDTHDFFTLMRKYGLTRTQALRLAPEGNFAEQVPNDTIRKVLSGASASGQPIMIFVGNPECIQIHTGLVKKVVDARGWFNVLDPELNLHLNDKAITQSWVVRKPSKDGMITSLECFNDRGEMIIQLFGARKPGIPEREDWRELITRILSRQERSHELRLDTSMTIREMVERNFADLKRTVKAKRTAMKRPIQMATACLMGLSVNAQTTETITLQPGYTEQVWLDLETGTETSAPMNEWDLAFQIHGWTASIKANTQKGSSVYRTPYAIGAWGTLDTTGMAAWPMLHDGDMSWNHGALNTGITSDSLDIGWGIYNYITHVVVGDSLFVVQLGNGDWKKLKIDNWAVGYYNFTYANLDGTDEVIASINTMDYTTKNFAYWSMENDMEIDREPASSDWDLTFTRYIADVPPLGAYGVTGVLSNSTAMVGKVDGMPTANAQWSDANMEGRINVIGFDWKEFNNMTFQWTIHDSLSYFVQTDEGNVWKLVFTGFGGSQTGDIIFTQEQVSTVGVEEFASTEMSVFPNPVSDGVITIDLQEEMTVGQLLLRDARGRIIRSYSSTGTIQRLMVDDLPAGIYHLELIDGTTRAVTPVMVQ